MFLESIDLYAKNWSKREQVELKYLSEWKDQLKELVADRISNLKGHFKSPKRLLESLTCLMSSSSVLATSSSIIFFLSSRYRISGWDDCWLDVIESGWVSVFPMINLYLTTDELSFDVSHKDVLGS